MSIQNTSSQTVLVNCSGGDDDPCGNVSGTSYWEEFCRRLMLHPLYLGAGRMKALRTCFCAALARLFFKIWQISEIPLKSSIQATFQKSAFEPLWTFFYFVHHLFFQNITFTFFLEIRQKMILLQKKEKGRSYFAVT